MRSMHTLLAAIVLLALPSPAAARWASRVDADATRTTSTWSYDVHKDGTYSFTVEESVLINSEAGRQAHGTGTVTYNAQASKFKLLSAAVEVGGKNVAVQPMHIEDRSVASEAVGFDAEHQVTIAFPRVAVGALLKMKYRIDVKEVPFPGSFTNYIEYGVGGIEDQASTVVIKSDLPLRYKLNDPTQALVATETKEGKRQVLTIRQVKPVYSQVVDEGDRVFQPLSLFTSLAVSSLENYEPLATSVAKDYEKVLNSKIPEALADIVTVAKQAKSLPDAADIVTSMLSERLRYMGDWRPTRGSYIPRPLATIATTQFGDCKDFAATVTALLRASGFQAHVAWVDRTEWPSELGPLPAAEFNHAIVRAEEGKKVYWLDGTNPTSFARYIPDDLIDRAVLIVDPAHPRLDRIRLPDAAENRTELTTVVSFQGTGSSAADAVEHHTIAMTGLAPEPITASGTWSTRESYDHELVQWLADKRRVRSAAVSKYNRDTRIVHDQTLTVDLDLQNAATRTTAGLSYELEDADIGGLVALDPAQFVSNLYLSPPKSYVRRATLSHAALVGHAPPPCRVSSQWLDAERRIEEQQGDVAIEEMVTYKRTFIANADLHGAPFAKLQTELRECYGTYAVVFTPLAGAATAH